MYRLAQFAILVSLALILSCGGDSGTNPPVPSSLKIGSFSLTVDGLPSGVAGDLRLTGPNGYSRTFTGTTTVDSLATGTYLLSCYSVTSGNLTFNPTPNSASIIIEENKTKTATITYASPSQKGSLIITVTGLPAGEDGYIRVTGPGITGYIEVNRNTTLDSLLSVSFLVEAFGITAANGLIYRPKVDSQTVVVVAGSSAAVTVEYEAQYGQVQINVSGLPSGEEAEIRFYESSFPETYHSLNQSFTIDSVAEGDYTVQAFEIEAADGEVYRPEHYYQSVSVKGGEVTVVDVVYFSKFGSISFVINGLPAGLSADVTLETPALDYGITESIVIDSLEEGNYAVTAKEVTATDGTVYKPDFESTTVTVDGGQTTSLAVNYIAKYGKISITISGLDSYTFADAEVTRDLTSWVVHESMIIDSLEEGEYDILAREVKDDEDYPFVPNFDSMRVSVVPGQMLDIEIIYEEKYGRIRVNISGLPFNLDAEVTVDGDNYSKTLTRTTTLDSLLKGNYRITAEDVPGLDGLTYKPREEEREQSIDLPGGGYRTVSVQYQPDKGWLKIQVTGLQDGTDAEINIKNDSGYTKHVAADIVLGPIPTGPYQIVADELIDIYGDSLRAIPESQTAIVNGGDTVTVAVNYYAQAKIKLFHAPFWVGQSEYMDWKIVIDGNNVDSTGISRKDRLTFPDPRGYIVQNCRPVGKDITNGGTGWNIGESGTRANAVSEIRIGYEENIRRLTMTGSGQAESTADNSVYKASGGAWADVYFSGDSLSNPPLLLRIDNPAQDSIVLTMKYSYTGNTTSSVAYANVASWIVSAGYQLNIDPCMTTPWASRENLIYTSAETSPGPKAESGEKRVVLTSSSNVGFFIALGTHAGTRAENYGLLSLYGSSTISMTVTVDIQIIKRRE